MLFQDRTDAGKRLATRLTAYERQPQTIVLGLPRGGVPVAFEVAQALELPLDVLIVRKLGLPDQKEMAMGAIASGHVRILNQRLLQNLQLSPEVIEQVTREEQRELERRERAYRGNRPPLELCDRTVILVDDGLATGATMKAAVAALQRQHPARIVVAVPVGSTHACQTFEKIIDDIVCAESPEPFSAIGLWYDNFDQTTDEEVRNLLKHRVSQPH